MEQLLSQSKISEKAPLKLTLSYDQTELQSKIAQSLIRMWSQSDMIRIIGEGMPRQKLLENIAKGDFQIARSGWCADYNDPAAFLSLFYSHSPDNKSGYTMKKWIACLSKVYNLFHRQNAPHFTVESSKFSNKRTWCCRYIKRWYRFISIRH